MPEAETSKRMTELEIEQEAILATIDELQKAFEVGELEEEDYKTSKEHYEEKLKSIDAEIEGLKGEVEVEAEAPAEAPAAEVTAEAEKVDYSEMSWDDLRALAKDKGISLGKGVTRETVEEELRKLDEGVVEAPAEVVEVVEAEAVEVEVPPEVVEVEAPPVEAVVVEVPKERPPPKMEIDPSIRARVEMIRGEIPSLNSTLVGLNMKKQISESSLKVLKKNRDDGLIDDATYDKLKEKYEEELATGNDKIKEITSEINARKNVISKYDALSEVQSKYQNVLNGLQDTLSGKRRELDFLESGKLYIVSNAKEYLKQITENLQVIEDESVATGVPYPNKEFLKGRKDEIKQEKDVLAELTIKLDNFQTLIDSLEKEKESGEVDEDTYSVLKTEYTKEKNRTEERMNKLTAHLKMMESVMGGYDKLNEAIVTCKSFIDITRDSLTRIWLEDDISKKKEEANKKTYEIRKQEDELSSKLEVLEEELSKLLKGTLS
ncbi:MAG: hypothetical protein V3T58_01215 [Candidatus Hydrothermarchaeales archaeon]